MGLLDNSGDIILDAVLSDTGRARLAKGDGSFRITKFALGDDEINYNSYNKDHPSGSAFFDLDILQTPVFEAFTDNGASMKSKLLSISRTNLLYLPVLKLNELAGNTELHASGAFIVAVDEDTENSLLTVNGSTVAGIIQGESLTTDGDTAAHIRVDQGLDTAEISANIAIDSDLVETQYIIEIDNRLGKIASVKDGSIARVSFIDDDNIASYYFSLGTDINYVAENESRSNDAVKQVIAGPRGTVLQFTIASSLELNTSDFLFEQLGGAVTMASKATTVSVNRIDTIVRVTGVTTGNKIDIPVRFVKLV
jgi:hypothetical protein